MSCGVSSRLHSYSGVCLRARSHQPLQAVRFLR